MDSRHFEADERTQFQVDRIAFFMCYLTYFLMVQVVFSPDIVLPADRTISSKKMTSAIGINVRLLQFNKDFPISAFIGSLAFNYAFGTQRVQVFS